MFVSAASILAAICVSAPSSTPAPEHDGKVGSLLPEVREKPVKPIGPGAPLPAAAEEPSPIIPTQAPAAPAPAPAVASRFADSSFSVLRGEGIDQRRVIDATLVTMRKARDLPAASERDAIKTLATRAASGEGDLVVWAASAGSASNQLLSAMGRGVAIQRMAAKLSRLPAARIGMHIGVGDQAAQDRILIALLAPASEPFAVPEPAAPKPEPPAVESKPVPPAPRKPAATSANPSASPAPNPVVTVEKPPVTTVAASPSPPPAASKPAAEDPLRAAIAAFQPALRSCVQTALKQDPSLHGEARVLLDITSDGHAKLAGIRSATLAGGGFEACVRQAAEHWTAPRMQVGHQVEIPLKILGAHAAAK